MGKDENNQSRMEFKFPLIIIMILTGAINKLVSPELPCKLEIHLSHLTAY